MGEQDREETGGTRKSLFGRAGNSQQTPKFGQMGKKELFPFRRMVSLIKRSSRPSFFHLPMAQLVFNLFQHHFPSFLAEIFAFLSRKMSVTANFLPKIKKS